MRIAHSSIDENRSPRGGEAGDQTGKEVKISRWYDGGWDYVARHPDRRIAERAAQAAEDGANNPMVGYDQGERNSLRTEAQRNNWNLSKIDTPCECDCSAFVSVCCMAGGARGFPAHGNLPTTQNLHQYLERAGYEILTDAETRKNPEKLMRGDVLCRIGVHAVMAIDNGNEVGKPVEPTPVKPAPVEPPKPSVEGVTYNVKLPLLVRKCRGKAVESMQALLNDHGYSCGAYGTDGHFGPATERALKRFQSANGLDPDGQCGGETWEKLITGI